jgi:opacity protein-like surface antigen
MDGDGLPATADQLSARQRLVFRISFQNRRGIGYGNTTVACRATFSCAYRVRVVGLRSLALYPADVFRHQASERAMTAHTRNLLQATLITSVLLPAVVALVPSTAAVAGDLPPTRPAPAWTWTGLYFGGNLGAAAGTTTFSDPLGPSVFGDKVNSAALLAGLQIGYNWQIAPRWVIGLQGDAGYMDSSGNFTCMQPSATILGSNCEVSPHVLASLTGRVGFLVDPLGHTLVYGKGGGAWMGSHISITPNQTGYPRAWGAGDPGNTQSSDSNAWGGTVGAGIEHALTPSWSIGLEYDYYRFATFNVSTPSTISSTGRSFDDDDKPIPPKFGTVAGGRSTVTQDLQVIKLALNYHWNANPDAAWADAPLFGSAAMPLRARTARTVPIPQRWEVDAGTRYWYSSGKEKNTSGNGILTSQLTYGNLTGQSGEFFARIDTPSRIFVKGYVGAGALNGGRATDEDWGDATHEKQGFMVSNSTSSGWLNYAAGDVGYSVFQNGNYKVGPFVGYSYFRQNTNAIGCTFAVPAGQECNGANKQPITSNQTILTQDETWQSLRVGASAVVRIWDRWGVNGDVAYLPYGQYSGQDIHWQRSPTSFYPQSATSRGVQAELILTYLVTDSLELGIGGRYWAMWTTSGSSSCNGGCDPDKPGVAFTNTPAFAFTANAERFGGFVQASYRFGSYP